MKNLCELPEHPKARSTLLRSNDAATRETGPDIWAIGSQASHVEEGSTTIPQGSRAQASPKRKGAVMAAMIWSDLHGNVQRAAGCGQSRNIHERKPQDVLPRSSGRPARKRAVNNSVNCRKPKASAKAISSEAAQECAERSETRSIEASIPLNVRKV